VLHVDLSKTLPPTTYQYFSAFMPGLFFVLSVFLANPDLASQLAVRSHDGFGFGRYFTLFLGLFLAFVIGNALMLFVSLVQYAIRCAYRIGQFLWKRYQTHILLPILMRVTHAWKILPATPVNPNPTRTPRWVLPKWVDTLYMRTQGKVQIIRNPNVPPTAAYKWWDTFARQVLLKRYDLPEDKLPAASFQPLQDVLTKPSAEELPGSVLINASHATGWAALAASRLGPDLRNKWYVTFAIFLIGCGLIQDFFVAKYLHDPDIGDIARLRALIREFPKIQQIRAAQRDSQEPLDGK
jgi:hypothetical protein